MKPVSKLTIAHPFWIPRVTPPIAFKWILFVLFFSIQPLGTQTSISWYSFNSGFARGSPSLNNGVGLGSLLSQSVVGMISGGTTTIQSGFFGHSDTAFRRFLTNVQQNIASTLPTEYALFQNYPNPFNPSTTIRFALPTETYVCVTVFNVLGQVVATLVDEKLPAGYHQVTWDTKNHPSGVYFYRLQTKDFTHTLKLLPMK